MGPMGRRSKYSPELRERAVRMVFEHAPEEPSQWGAIRSVAEKIGCPVEVLLRWVRHAERDTGQRPGLTTDERARLKQLEKDNFELRRANEILKKASHISPRRSSTAERSDGRVHRRSSGPVWGRADLRCAAARPIDVLQAQSGTAGTRAARGAGAGR